MNVVAFNKNKSQKLSFKVCEDLHDPSIRLNQIGIQIFDAFKPQLADRIQLANLETIMKVGKTTIRNAISKASSLEEGFHQGVREGTIDRIFNF